MNRRKHVIIAKLKPKHLHDYERLLPDLEFPKEFFEVRLPLDVPFDPNSTYGNPPNIGSEGGHDHQVLKNFSSWTNWRSSPTKGEDEEASRATSWMKEKKHGKARSMWHYKIFQRKRKIWGACGNYIEEENGALPIELRYDGECTLHGVVFDSFTPERGYKIEAYRLRVANVLAICFSVTDLSALEQIPHRWIPLIRHRCPVLPIVLIACDIEKRTEHPHVTTKTSHDQIDTRGARYITQNQGEKIAKEIGAAYYIECSRTTGKNVELAYQAMAAALIHKEEKGGADKGNKRDKKNSHTKITLSQNDWERGTVFPNAEKNGWFNVSKSYSVRGY